MSLRTRLCWMGGRLVSEIWPYPAVSLGTRLLCESKDSSLLDGGSASFRDLALPCNESRDSSLLDKGWVVLETWCYLTTSLGTRLRCESRDSSLLNERSASFEDLALPCS